MAHRSLALMLTALSVSALSAGQQPAEQPLPRFRAGTNLVRVDAYVSLNGQPLIDLTAADFEVFEDDKPQAIETFELIDARGSGAVASVETPVISSTREMQAAAQDPEARVFIIYLDLWHVGLDGSYRSPAPIARLLEKVIGPGDLVGLMTPEITPQNLTLVRRGQGLEDVLRDGWTWGQRDRAVTADPRETDIQGCYPDGGSTAGIAKEIIERRREEKTLRSLASTIGYLDGLRDERKFVVLLSEGWVLFRQNDRLAAVINGGPASTRPPIGVGIDGRVTSRPDPREGGASNYDWCERERVRLSYIDHTLEVRQLAQRANRANVSFYPVDPRGLPVFDDSLGPPRPATPAEDRERLRARQDGLRELAEQTDGAWVLNTNDTAGALERLLADTRSYYLLSYYSTNSKLDGRFRRITVRVKREGAEVRARPGYLAPTEAEARAAGAGAGGSGAGARAAPPPGVTRALDAIVPGRGNLPIRVQASGLQDRLRAVVELDPATLKQREWQAGAELRLTIESERGSTPQVLERRMSPGLRSVVIDGPDEALAPGRYIVRVEARPPGGGPSARASADAVVGAAGASIGTYPLAFRRGPTTGLAYEATADPRFRRTERLRLEVPVLAEGPVTAEGRVLTREGQALPLAVTMAERTDAADGRRYLVADVTLAPLAQGDFVVQVSTSGGRESATYGFRVVP